MKRAKSAGSRGGTSGSVEPFAHDGAPTTTTSTLMPRARRAVDELVERADLGRVPAAGPAGSIWSQRTKVRTQPTPSADAWSTAGPAWRRRR